MKTDADVGGKFWIFRHQPLRRAHDEFEMRDVIAFLRADHKKIILIGRRSVQAVSSVKHEYLERGDPIVESKGFHFINVPGFNRRNMVTVINPESSLGLLEYLGHEATVWTASVQIIAPGAHVVEA